MHDVAVSAVCHAVGLCLAFGEVGRGRRGVVGYGRAAGVSKHILRAGQLDNCECHAVRHGERELQGTAVLGSRAGGGHQVGGGVACGVDALVGFWYPAGDERGEEIGIAHIGCRYRGCFADHIRLVRVIEVVCLILEAAGKGHARFGLPGQSAVRGSGGGQLHIGIGQLPAAHDVEPAGIAGSEPGGVAVLHGTGLRYAGRATAIAVGRGIAAVGHGDGKRLCAVRSNSRQLLPLARGGKQHRCRHPNGM